MSLEERPIYRVLQQVPDALQAWVDRHQAEPGVHFFDDGTHQYVLIALGQRKTGGHSVAIDAVEWDGDTVLVHYHERLPGPHTLVTQVISYPTVLLEVEERQVRVLAVQGPAVPV